MGTAQACGGGCAPLVQLRQTQTSHIHKKKCSGSYLPLIRAPAHSYQTIKSRRQEREKQQTKVPLGREGRGDRVEDRALGGKEETVFLKWTVCGR